MAIQRPFREALTINAPCAQFVQIIVVPLTSFRSCHAISVRPANDAELQTLTIADLVNGTECLY